MVIVLIHWRIKPTDEAVASFFDKWKYGLTIENKANLVGEFLSQPIPANELPFAVDDLASKSNEVAHRAFVNVGFWKDWEAFFKEIGHNFNDDRLPLEFEAAQRTRTILVTKEWRVGAWRLPDQSTAA